MKNETRDDVWVGFPGCECLKDILIKCGYDNAHSLICLNENRLNQLEDNVDLNRSLIPMHLKCNHIEIYAEQVKFKLLLGHRAMLLQWSENLLQGQRNQTFGTTPDSSFRTNSAAFSPITQQIVLTALSNYNKLPNGRRFSDLLTNFSIYIYIMAGKACYEILAANLPLPTAGSISKFIVLDWMTFRLDIEFRIFHLVICSKVKCQLKLTR